NLDGSRWSFAYVGQTGDSTSNTLYLPEGRAVRLRFAPRDPRRAAPRQASGERSQTTVRLRPSRPGVLTVPCAPLHRGGRCVIKADVVEPGDLWSRLDQHTAAPSEIPQAQPQRSSHPA